MTTEVARADGDIERFIRDQKQKLQQERDYIMDNDDPLTGRRQWQRSDLVYAEEQDEQNKTRRGLYNYDEVSKASMNEKRREYQEYLQKGQKSDQKAQVDFEQWDREFQEEKRKEYNDYLRKKNTGRHGTTRKKNTPENEGLVFGEFEEYKKQTEAERKKQYKEDLERQRQDQLLVKMKRDFPNKATFASPPNTERQYREEQRHRIEEQRHKEFDKMLAQPHHEEHEQITPRQPVPRRSVRQVQPSPEFSDPGMQAQADRIRKERLRQHDLPTRPEEIERLQRDQQRIDDLERQLQETSVRDRYPERLRNNQPPPNQDYSPRDYQVADISPRQDAYAPRQDYSPRGVPQDYSPRGINVQPLDLRENPQSSIGAGVLGGVELSSRLSGNATKKRQLEAERTRETQMILAQQKQRPKRSNFGGENISLPISENDDKRKKLADERNKEMQDFLKKQDEKKNKKDLSGDGKSLPISGHEEKRRKLAEERRREYNEMPDAQILSSLPLGQYEFERERIEADRARERESQLPKRTEAARRLGAQQNQRPETPDGLFGKLGRKQEEKKSALNEERKEEYKQLLQKQTSSLMEMLRVSGQKEVDPTVPIQTGEIIEGTPPRDDAPPLDIETRPPRAPRPHSEGRRGRAPPREIEPEPEVVQRPSKRQHQDETFAATLPGLGEREREEQEDIVTDLPATGSWSLKWTERKPGYVDAKPYSILKQQKRNQEYNDMKRVIEEKEKNRFADKKPPIPKSRQPRHGYIESPEEEVRQQPQVDYREPVSRPPPEPQPAPARNRRKQRSADGFEASLPGLKSHSAEARRKEEERNREYNDMLRKLEERKGTRGRGTLGPPRKGWQTPNYDDVLDQKRREEANYRRNDPFEGRGMRSYASEGAINRTGLEDRKIRDLDREYDSRMVRFQSERARDGGILEDDNWLRASDVQKEREYKQLEPKSDSELEENPRYTHRNREEPETRKEMPAPAGEFYATLPLGGNKGDPDRESAKRRRKDKYRGELELQMREHVAAKNRGTEAKIGGFYGEKNEGLLVNASGYLDPEKTSMRVKSLGNTDLTPRGRVRSPEVRPYHTKFEQISNARGGGGGLGIEYGGINYDGGGKRERGRPRERNVGGFGSAREISGNYGDSSILDTPFDASLLQPRRPVASLPPGLTYQPTFADLDTDTGIPSTYITGGTEGGSADINAIYDAYRYYGMKNPLEPESSGGAMVPSLNLNKSSEAPVRERARSPRVTFDESARARSRSRGRSTPYQFDSSDSGGAYDKRSYAAELERQMEIKKLQKEREKHEQMLRDRKLEEDMLNYNPFGRAGGGAPNLDSSGKPIADLRQMRATNDTPRAPPPRESPRYPVAATPRDDLIPPPPAQLNAEGEQTYALGGHGIFGQPKTEYEKTQADKYKEDLRNQILEKKRQEQLEKERERIEEEKENRRLEEQRRRIQMEYEEEQRKKKEKEQENLRKQEELIRKNEEKRREAERAKREKAEQRQRERERQQQEERAQEQASQVRSSSPPIPAIRSKMATSDGVPDSQPPSLSGNSREASVHRELNNKSSNALPSWFREPSVSFTPLPQNSFMVTNSEGDSKISPRNASRTNSPPLAANRNRDTPSRGEQARPAPEPITQRPASSDVLKELASMRKQLENERRRVEGALDKQMHEPEVFDPRLVQKPPARSQVNVFESAKQGNAVVPQRVSDTANPKNVQDFQNLKFKEGETNQVPIQPPVAAPVVPTSVDQDGDTDSRRAFRSMFPDHPHTNSVLEHQQDAMLRQQEDQLKNLKDRMYAPKMQGYVPPKDLGISARQGTGTPRSMLQSNTAFIDVDQFNHFPEDFEDMPKRNDSARARRRERVTPAMDGPSTMGSVTSLDVDRLQRKNDARLRRLQQMNADEVSMADPDEILDNFMNKQKYQRPPSGQTLQDDTWLRPGSKQL